MARTKNRWGNVEIYKDYSSLLDDDSDVYIEDDYITEEEMKGLQAYIINEGWAAYRAQTAGTQQQIQR
jgi:hypothetical protein